MNITSGWTIAVIAVAALVQPATPRAQFDCAITKVVITNTPESGTSVRLKVQLNFWIDDADKSLTFADGARLRVIRFDPSWIGGYRDDGGLKANGETVKTARVIESVAASNVGVAVLQAMAQMKPARRKLMVTLARALRDME